MSRKLKAVVIDRLDLVRDFLADVLRERGYDVSSYASPEDFNCCCHGCCECRADEESVDLLLTDNRMIPFSGLELIERQLTCNCRRLARNRAIISGGWTLDEKLKAGRLGCETFEKPCRLETIHTWLDQCESRSHGLNNNH